MEEEKKAPKRYCSDCGAELDSKTLKATENRYNTVTGERREFIVFSYKCPNRKWHHLLRHDEYMMDELGVICFPTA